MDARTLALPIDAVTVHEDRALVTRRATEDLEAGTSSLRIDGVSPTIIDKTLAVALAGGRVVQARVVRVPSRTRASQDEKRASWMEREEVCRRAAEDAQLRHELASDQVASLRRVESLELDELAEDVALGRDVSPRMDVLASVRAEIAAAIERSVEAARASSRAQREHADAQAMLQSSDGEERTFVAHLELQVHVEAAGPVELTIRYAVAGAMWRPAHVATLHEDGRVTMLSRACVWQATGEDWTDASLDFSTERPSLGTTAPRLQTDVLSLRAKSTDVQVQARDQVIATTGEGAAGVRDEMPGVDDGGEPLALRAEQRATVVANGRPHHVALFSFESPAQQELVCRGEKVEAVLVRTTQAHRGAHPLLAGPVELRRRGGFVGRTSILFVAPGESFEIGWGPDPDLRVHRKVEHGEHTRRPLSAWVRKPRTVTVKISNLGPQPRTLRLQERMVVSEIDKVEVEEDARTGGEVDDDGILSATVDVRGFGETSFSFAWTLVVHDDVKGI